MLWALKTNPANERFAQHLWNHREQLFTFLRVPGLDATNWRGEQAIRGGVILRKVWGGNRTEIGGRAQSVLMSIWRTCWQRGISPLERTIRVAARRVALAVTAGSALVATGATAAAAHLASWVPITLGGLGGTFTALLLLDLLRGGR